MRCCTGAPEFHDSATNLFTDQSSVACPLNNYTMLLVGNFHPFLEVANTDANRADS